MNPQTPAAGFLRYAVAILASALLVSPALAAPAITNVSGEVARGSVLTISGSGFGTKATAAPRIWDDFESGTNGQSIHGRPPVVGPNWDTYTSHGTLPAYCNVANRPNSSLCSRHDFVVSGQYNCSLEYYEVTDTAYFSFWWKYSKQQEFFNRNTKPWIEYGQTGGYYPLMYNGFGNPDYGDGSLRDSIQDDPMPTGPTKWGSPNLSNIVDEWIRFEVYAVQSTPNVSDGALRTWVHRPYAGSPSIVLSLNNPNRMMRTGSHQWRQWHFGSYHARDVVPSGGGGPASAYIYTDDLYFDVTLARVELGNAATWSGCTRREIQIPSAWSASSIAVTVNQGGFALGASAYVYVVDSAGLSNSSGYPVTIGGATYTLTVNSGSGGGQYAAGTVVAIAADAAPTAKRFDAWTGDVAGIADVSAAATTITMPAANAEITATYTDILYALTVNSGSGGGQYAAGTVVAIAADAAPTAKQFDAWTGDVAGIADVNASATTITMPAADAEITATYTDILYALTVNRGSGGGQYAAGTVVAISADAAPTEKIFEQWAGDTAGIAEVSDAETTITMPAGNAQVTATYRYPGDLNKDGVVGQTDLDMVLDNWGQHVPPADPRADQSGDDFVGQTDLDYVLYDWGKGF